MGIEAETPEQIRHQPISSGRYAWIEQASSCGSSGQKDARVNARHRMSSHRVQQLDFERHSYHSWLVVDTNVTVVTLQCFCKPRVSMMWLVM